MLQYPKLSIVFGGVLDISSFNLAAAVQLENSIISTIYVFLKLIDPKKAFVSMSTALLVEVWRTLARSTGKLGLPRDMVSVISIVNVQPDK